ncbi:MAG: BolA family protein [Gammaproteobacteria bacterium]
MDRVAAIRERLGKLAPQRLDIVDDSQQHVGHAGAASGGGHFSVLIVAPGFDGCSGIERHRMVYQALADLMPREIHALSIKALTPDELQSQRDA